MCGQIQCTDSLRPRPNVDYGSGYKTMTLPSGVKCRLKNLIKFRLNMGPCVRLKN